MVSTRVLTPAVWTETARNLAANPSFEAPGAAVEAHRNYVPSPFGSAALPGYFGYPASTPAVESNTGGASLAGVSALPVPGHPSSALSVGIPAGAAVGGGVCLATGLPAGDYVVSMWVNRRSGPTTQFGFVLRGLAAVGAPRTFTFDQWTFVEESFTVTPAQAPAIIGWRTANVVDPAQSNFLIANMQVTPAWQKRPQGALAVSGAGGAYDPDLSLSWTGSPEASPSILTGVGMPGVSGQGCLAIRSGQWAKEGQYSLRLIPTSTTSNVSYAVVLGATDARGTFAITRRIIAPITGSTWAAGLGRAYWNPTPQVFTNLAPNVAGEAELRAYAPAVAGGTNSNLILAHGGLAGSGDVWFDMAGIFPGVDYPGAVFSGSTVAADPARRRYRWVGDANASQSVDEIMTAAEVLEQVYEVVTLESETDLITFRATPGANGFVYDNESLERWYKRAESVVKNSKRPNAHGSYSLGQLFTKEHRPLVSGSFFGMSSAEAKAARRRLVAMFNDGLPVKMTVTDEDGVATSRTVWLTDIDAPFVHDFSYFHFDIELNAPDPRRYGGSTSSTDGMPTGGSGLFWDLGTAPSGLYFDWGTPGVAGQVAYTNTGQSSTFPRLEIGGSGTIGNGFRVTEVETGRELTYVQTVEFGQVVVLDSRTQRATLGGGDVTGLLSSRKWFEIPRGATRRYQITPLGSVTGDPKITIIAASADM